MRICYSPQLAGDAAKAALVAWACEQLAAQAARAAKLADAFREADLELPADVDCSRARVFTSIRHAARASLEQGLLFFLRGPRSADERADMRHWTKSSIRVLVDTGAC